MTLSPNTYTSSAGGEPLEHWLTQKMLSARLNISERTLERMRHDGTGPRFTKAGRKVLYRADHVENWLTDRSFASTAESRRLRGR